MAFDTRAQRLPLKIEILDEKYTLRIADVEDRAIASVDGRAQLLYNGRAHIHFERKTAPVPFEQEQMLEACASGDANRTADGAFFEKKCSRTARAVAGNLAAAAIGVP